jgi:hypothetical protein
VKGSFTWLLRVQERVSASRRLGASGVVWSEASPQRHRLFGALECPRSSRSKFEIQLSFLRHH